MVLFKSKYLQQCTSQIYNLHSTMVLFKFDTYKKIQTQSLKFTFHYGPIQIVAGIVIAYITCKFTFHYGPIQISIIIALYDVLGINLHSTMVLFKSVFCWCNLPVFPIYIPLWSYSNPSDLYLILRCLHIYIPLWSYSNEIHAALMSRAKDLHSTMVLFK